LITSAKFNINRIIRLPFLSLIIPALCITVLADKPESNLKTILSKIDLLPEYYFQQDARTYSNYKNEEFKEAFLVSGKTEFEAMFVSYDEIVFWGMYYSTYIGMGRQNASILFSPRDTYYTLRPFFEYRRGGLFYQSGLDHTCFHQVDRKERDTPYWNEIYLQISSDNYRFQLQREYLLEASVWEFFDRLRWQFRAGYFIREFGNVDKTIINGGHPFANNFSLGTGYSFFKSSHWILGAHHNLALFRGTAGTNYWSGAFELSADLYSFKHTLGFFINYNYEPGRGMPMYDSSEYFKSENYKGEKKMMPLFSKDQLIEFGIRWRY